MHGSGFNSTISKKKLVVCGLLFIVFSSKELLTFELLIGSQPPTQNNKP